MSAVSEGALYKVALFLTRNPEIGADVFSDRWLSVTASVRPAGLFWHIHNAPALMEVPIENAPPAPFDAVDEFLFDDAAKAVAWFESTEFQDNWLGPRTALLGGPILSVSGIAVELWRQPGEPSANAVKILTLPVRRQGMTMDEFTEHWIVTHAGLALAGPDTRQGLLQLVSTPADRRDFPAFAPAPFDGIGIIQFASVESLNAEFASDHYREVMAPDEPRFTDPARSQAMMVREFVIHSPAGM